MKSELESQKISSENVGLLMENIWLRHQAGLKQRPNNVSLTTRWVVVLASTFAPQWGQVHLPSSASNSLPHIRHTALPFLYFRA